MSEGCQEMTAFDSEMECVAVSKKRLTEVLRTLIVKLPDMLAEQAENAPMAMRLALPGLRMFLSSDSMQETLASDGLVSFVWEALQQCQSPD